MKTIQLTKEKRQEIEKRRRYTNNRQVYQRLSALLWLDDGKTREEVADLLGVSSRQVGNWLRIFRNQGLENLCALRYKGDPGFLSALQIELLTAEVAKGVFHSARQICAWILDSFGIAYSLSGVKDLLQRLGVTYHKVSGFFAKADRSKQRSFRKKYQRHKREQKKAQDAGQEIRHYFVDACHPVWGVGLLYNCWLLRGQRFYVGVGNGRKRLNILGAYCPEDHEYVDLRLPKENITGEVFVRLLDKLHDKHPTAVKIILYLDNAKYYSKPCVKEWQKKHPEFHLVFLPAYSPNLNLIERLWKFMKGKALKKWHKTFEAMQEAVANVLDHLQDYSNELKTLMQDDFHILKDHEVPAAMQAK